MLTAEALHGFVGSLLSKRYDNPVPTPNFHLELWDLCCSNHPMVAIAAPRGHGKSTAVSHAYILASVLFKESKFVVLVSDTETQASLFLNDIKQDLKENEDLIELFGIKKFRKESETDIIVEFHDGDAFRILVRGAEQRVRGLKWNQARPDLIVCDDLENEEAVANKDRREKFKRWFNGALLPCKAKHGKVRVVGTVMHLDSLLNNLLPEDSDKFSIITPLKTYSTRENVKWKAVRYRAHNEDFSKILWPEYHSRDFFEKEREDYFNKGIPEVYAQEYLNYPIDESTSYFKRSDFLEIREKDLESIHFKERNYNYYVGCDLAVSTVERSDFSVFVVAAVDDRGIVNVVDLRRGRWDSLEIIDEFFAIQNKYSPEWFALEKGAIEKSISPIIRAEMINRGIYLSFILHTANKDKQTRARSIQARLRAGGVKFDKTADWYLDFEDELVRFPKARHDDAVDAFAWLGYTLDEVRASLSQEEEEDLEYQEMMKGQEQGRSLVCGY